MYDETDTVAFSTDLAQKSYNLRNTHRRLAFSKDRLFMFSPVIFFRKKSVLTKEFNNQLEMLREAGLIDYWTKNYIDARKSNSKQREPTKLEMISIMAAFQICGALYLISFIVFILELFSTKSRRIKNLVDFFTY